MNRREFLAGAGAMALGGCMTGGAGGDGAGAPLKVCVFSDIHYHPKWWTNDKVEFLEAIMQRAADEKCDFMIHLGDLVHRISEPDERAYIKLYNDFRPVPGYHMLGNHDQDRAPYRRVCEAYRMPNNYYSFDRGGFRFICCDPNYYCEKPGEYIHHENGNYGRRSKGSTINWIPPDQLEWLRDRVMNSPYPCVVLSHQSFERPRHVRGVMNQDEVRAIFNEANALHPGRVRLVMNGHHHVNYSRILDNVLYWDVNSANYHYYDQRHEKYPASYLATNPGSPWNIGWTKPLSAILSLWPDGRIRIDGSEAEFLFGVSPEAAGLNPYDPCGRLVEPKISSLDIRI